MGGHWESIETNWFCIIFEGYLVDVNGTVKLVDFGLAKTKSFKGTAFWMAPEVINEDKRENDGYGFAADTWSLGNIHIPNWSRVVWVENGIKMSLGLSMEQIAVGFEG
ncbi:hypothetical protein AAG906_021724 [Vitis piasezkii]